MDKATFVRRIAIATVAMVVMGSAVFFAACNMEPPIQTPASITEGTPPSPSLAGRRPGGAARPRGTTAAPAPADVGAVADRFWRMYGGSPQRNMINTVERGLPDAWDIKTKKNIKWMTELGSQSMGNPVVYKGKIFLGTNNDGLKNPRDAKAPAKAGGKPQAIDKGVIMCLREADGKLLWQAIHDKLESGRVNDWPLQGVCSSPFVEDDRIYYVSNRCELICADTEGFANGNQGIQDEKYKDPTDADIIWKLDMMAPPLNVFPHNLAVCSPIVIDDLVFVVTGNGHDESHENIPQPNAPSFLAVNKKTGEVAWHNNAPGEKILHGQWSNPCYAEINGKGQVIFPGGDGWLRSFEPKTGKMLWQFDVNPKASKYVLGGRGTRNEIIATPIVYENRVYVGVGQDPEHGEGVGHLWCIDASKTGDLSPVNDNFNPKDPVNKNSGLVWHHGGLEAGSDDAKMIFRRTMSTCAIHEDLLYIANLSGFIQCLDAKTGKLHWEHDTTSAIWGSTFCVDGKVYVGTEEGDVYIFQHGKEKKLIAKIDMGEPVKSTPVAVNGVLYVMAFSKLYAIEAK